MKNLIYILVLFCGSLFGQNQNLFDQATKEYASGDYGAAIENYEKILESGETSAALYYNLANAHYKLNHVAPSIYYYEKALQLKPNDEDVLNNLAFAQKMTLDAINTVPKTGFSEWMDQLVSNFNMDIWAWSAVVFSVFFTIFFLAYYFSRSTSRKRLLFGLATAFFVLAILCAVFAKMRFNIQQNAQFAIVFSEEAPVNSEPNSRSDEVFLLHEGTKVKVIESFGEWFEIKLSDGKEGWILQNDVRKL